MYLKVEVEERGRNTVCSTLGCHVRMALVMVGIEMSAFAKQMRCFNSFKYWVMVLYFLDGTFESLCGALDLKGRNLWLCSCKIRAWRKQVAKVGCSSNKGQTGQSGSVLTV